MKFKPGDLIVIKYLPRNWQSGHEVGKTYVVKSIQSNPHCENAVSTEDPGLGVVRPEICEL